MHARSSLSEQQRELLVDLFEQAVGYKAASIQQGLKPAPARLLFQRWRLHGRICLMRKPSNQSYSFAVKKEVVERFLAGETRMELAREFALSSPGIVKRWVHLWRQGGDEALIPKPKGRPQGSSKSQPLSEQDRLRRRVEQLEAENAYLKKIAGLEEPGTRLKAQAIVILKRIGF